MRAARGKDSSDCHASYNRQNSCRVGGSTRGISLDVLHVSSFFGLTRSLQILGKSTALSFVVLCL